MFLVVLALIDCQVEAAEGWHYPDPNKNERKPLHFSKSLRNILYVFIKIAEKF